MTKHILLIQGHPDSSIRHLCNDLEDAYASGAIAAKNELRSVHVADLDFPFLRSKQEWEKGALPESLVQAQKDIQWADHLVIFFPLWLGGMPALLKGFLEQVVRPDFAFEGDAKNPFALKKLTGRSARVIVTMGMPALIYRWYFRAHSVKSLERNILSFIGIKPVKETLIGMVENMGVDSINKWEMKLQKLGEKGH